MMKLYINSIDALAGDSYRVRLRDHAGHLFTVVVSEAALRDQDQFTEQVKVRTGYVFKPPSDRPWREVIEQKLEASVRRRNPIQYYQALWARHERERELKGR